jgi:hypothetical protein
MMMALVLFIGSEKCAEGVVAIMGQFGLPPYSICSLFGAKEKILSGD